MRTTGTRLGAQMRAAGRLGCLRSHATSLSPRERQLVHNLQSVLCKRAERIAMRGLPPARDSRGRVLESSTTTRGSLARRCYVVDQAVGGRWLLVEKRSCCCRKSAHDEKFSAPPILIPCGGGSSRTGLPTNGVIAIARQCTCRRGGCGTEPGVRGRTGAVSGVCNSAATSVPRTSHRVVLGAAHPLHCARMRLPMRAVSTKQHPIAKQHKRNNPSNHKKVFSVDQ